MSGAETQRPVALPRCCDELGCSHDPATQGVPTAVLPPHDEVAVYLRARRVTTDALVHQMRALMVLTPAQTAEANRRWDAGDRG